MTDIDAEIAEHYRRAALTERIDAAIVALGEDPRRFDPDLIAPLDEFHLGGRPATAALFDQLAVAEGAELLDVGSGIGGPARFIARSRRCHVTGVDLTADYVDLASSLSARCGLASLVEFRCASALSLPFEDRSFDGAYQLHVGMNIADKHALCLEVARVLRPGGFYAIYDVMATGDGALEFPVPWAATPATSAVATPAAYRAALAAAGFTVTSERDRREVVLEFVRRLRAETTSRAPSPLGLHLVMGDDVALKVANLNAALEAGTVAPVEIIATRNPA